MVKGYHKDIKDTKKANEVRDKAHEVLVVLVGQLAEEIAQIKRERDVLANGTMVDGDMVEEVIELTEQETECWNRAEDITPQDESEPKEAQVHIHPASILITPTNKVGDAGSGIRIQRVALQDIGQVVKKRPQSSCRVKEKESGFGMPTTERMLETRWANVHFDRHERQIRCAVVTGANKGIGFEICRQLALNKIQVILTARNESRGIEAVKKLNASGVQNVIFHQLDVKDPTSISHLVKFIETHFKKIDILVNNAAVLGIHYVVETLLYSGGQVQIVDKNGDYLPGVIQETYEMGEECLETNYYGTKKVTEALVPLLQLSKSPKIVNVTSSYGQLSHIPNDELKRELDDIDNLTKERINEIIRSFLRDFKAAKLRENGWPLTPSAYKVSKAAINAYTRLMAKELKYILVNCVDPGHVKTDMSFNTGKDVMEGAKGPVMAALLPDEGPSGVYFEQTVIAPF
ncbi:(+)-neomenthol dehydrogenase [Helianthus annuus]|nr:(+)-neomenthol dehydrogenase [Helianthus annuus]